MTPHNLTKSDLSQFNGSDTIYYHPAFHYQYTEGVRYVAKNGGAWWLLDAIHSWQSTALKKSAKLQEFQLWTLKIGKERSARLACQEDFNKPRLITQEIEYTDFPLTSLKIYVIDGLMMLPSEY